MRTRLMVALLISLLAPALLASTVGAAGGRASAPAARTLSTVLTGAQEVPGPGDPDGIGFARLTLDPERGTICYTLLVANIAPATAAHIHRAPPGQAGPVVVTLTPPTRGIAADCVTVEPALVRAIAQNPSNYYVNVHNAEYPAGALRGQLGP